MALIKNFSVAIGTVGTGKTDILLEEKSVYIFSLLFIQINIVSIVPIATEYSNKYFFHEKPKYFFLLFFLQILLTFKNFRNANFFLFNIIVKKKVKI